MSYFPKLDQQYHIFRAWLDLRKEQGANVSAVEREARGFLADLSRILEKVNPPFTDKYHEPIKLEDIRHARPKGPRTLPYNLTDEQLYDKMLGALLGRSAGCILGIP
ncbi:MAG: hypothetical protein QME62_14090, partial [Armatimonadota bacterium]|nr:hypothetical protein [Armatimonadota bacterium]